MRYCSLIIARKFFFFFWFSSACHCDLVCCCWQGKSSVSACCWPQTVKQLWRSCRCFSPSTPGTNAMCSNPDKRKLARKVLMTCRLVPKSQLPLSQLVCTFIYLFLKKSLLLFSFFIDHSRVDDFIVKVFTYLSDSRSHWGMFDLVVQVKVAKCRFYGMFSSLQVRYADCCSWVGAVDCK